MAHIACSSQGSISNCFYSTYLKDELVTVEIIHFDAIQITSLKKNRKALTGSQSTIKDLPFSLKILKMNSWTFVLHRKILCHPSNSKRPPQHLWVKYVKMLNFKLISSYTTGDRPAELHGSQECFKKSHPTLEEALNLQVQIQTFCNNRAILKVGQKWGLLILCQWKSAEEKSPNLYHYKLKDSYTVMHALSQKYYFTVAEGPHWVSARLPSKQSRQCENSRS